MSPGAATEFRADLGLVRDAVRAGVVPSRARAADKHWDRWADFCRSIDLDPWLYEVYDPVPILQIFGARYRDGRLAPSKASVRAGTVDDALRAIGQTFASLGSKDIRKDSLGGIDFRLQRQLRSYRRADPPPDRVKPIPIQVLMHALAAAYGAAGTSGTQCISDMACIAFFFLLRPGEYTGTTGDNAPFRLRDVQLFIGLRRLSLMTAPLADLQAATHTSLTFTDQKNGVRGEVVNHSRSGSPLTCPVLAIIRRIVHLREHHAPLNMPLASYYSDINNR